MDMKQKDNVMVATGNVLDKSLRKAGAWLSEKKNLISAWVGFLMVSILTNPLVTSATDDDKDTADASWNTVMEFIVTWIPRLGGVLLFIGGVEFAIAYKNEDANGKTNAVRLMVSGAMVIAIPKALKSLLMV